MKLEKWEYKHGKKTMVHLIEPKVQSNTLCGYAIDGDFEQDEFEAVGVTTDKIDCKECLELINAIKKFKL